MLREAVYVEEGMVCGNSVISTPNFGVNLKLPWKTKSINFFDPIILFAECMSVFFSTLSQLLTLTLTAHKISIDLVLDRNLTEISKYTFIYLRQFNLDSAT